MILFLALRNLIRMRKRYALIAAAVAGGFATVTIITGLAYGALGTIQDKAARYFAGHVSVTGYLPDRIWSIPEHRAVMEAIETARLPIRTIAARATYEKNDASMFFGGKSIRQRKLIGMDFAKEGPELGGLSFSEGGVDGMERESGVNGVLISETAARILGCRLGDDLSLSITTDAGQFNTATLIVRGIFQEKSLFGYAAYMRAEDLNKLRLRAPDAVTDIAVYVRNGENTAKLAERLRVVLSRRFSVFPALASREARSAQLSQGITGPTLAVLSLNAQLAQITQLLNALLAVTYFTLALFLAIVAVGILNTYRVFVHERTREIGAMRAIGMKRGGICRLFLTEAAALAIISMAAGLIAGLTAMKLLSSINLSSLPAAGMFLQNGRLGMYLDARVALWNASLMFSSVVLSAWGPARQAGAIHPAEAMRTV